MYIEKKSKKGPIVFLLVVTIISFSILMSFYKAMHNETVEFTVDSKESRCPGGDRDCYFLVLTREGEMYENKDTLLNAKWDSGDLQAKLQSGKRYRAQVVGWRIPFLSMRKNIISAEELP